MPDASYLWAFAAASFKCGVSVSPKERNGEVNCNKNSLRKRIKQNHSFCRALWLSCTLVSRLFLTAIDPCMAALLGAQVELVLRVLAVSVGWWESVCSPPSASVFLFQVPVCGRLAGLCEPGEGNSVISQQDLGVEDFYFDSSALALVDLLILQKCSFPLWSLVVYRTRDYPRRRRHTLTAYQ